MNMKKLFLSIFMILAGVSSIFAQQKNYAQMNITEAYLDEEDYSAQYAEEGAFLAFYKSESGDFCMANVWPKADTQSYGHITDWTAFYNEATETDYACDEYHFKWHYSNSYDENTGVAFCSLIRLYKPEGFTYALLYQLEDDSMAYYSGDMHGDFDEFAKVLDNFQSNGLIGKWEASTFEVLNEDGQVMMTINAKNSGISMIAYFGQDEKGWMTESDDEGTDEYEFSYVYDAPFVYIAQDGETYELKYENGQLYMDTFDEIHIRINFEKAE